MSYDELATKDLVEKTITALEPRGIKAVVVDRRGDALTRLKELIPVGSEIMTGGSTTLDQIGFVELLKSKQHPWKNLKDEIFAEIAEAEGHHPDIHIIYNRVKLELFTHAIGGLFQNDFIMAAKIDSLVQL